MEKKIWTRPLAEVEQFMANEYIAACGESGVVYKFNCNAGGGVYGTVYQETNGVAGLQTGSGGDKKLATYDYFPILGESGFHACSKKHEAENYESDFVEGYYLPKGRTDGMMNVVIWTDGGTNVHCTTVLDKNEWETAKS